MMRVFISHSAKDADLAEAMIALLRDALPLKSSDIRCSSVDGYRLPLGADTDETLRREVFEAELLVGLLTPVSLASTYVLFELGARWGMKRSIAPLLARGATPGLLPGPLARANALDISTAGQIQQFVHDAARILEVSLEPAASYQKDVDNVRLLASKGVLPPKASSRKPARRWAFLSGFGLGNPIAIAPFEIRGEAGEADDNGLAEILEALGNCGLDSPDIDTLREAVSRKFGSDAKREDILSFFDAVHRIREQARRELQSPIREWYVVGELLGRINAFCLMTDVDIEPDAIALESMTDMLDGPATLVEQLRRFSQEIRATENIRPFFERTQLLAKVMFDVLDS